MRTLMAGTAAVIIAAGVLAGTAQAHEFRPGWGYASVVDTPFADQGGAPLPATQAFPRGTIKDLGTPDGWAVRMTVTAYSAANASLGSYTVTERHAVYTPFDRPLNAAPNEIAYLLYDFCRADGTCAETLRIARPQAPAPPGPDPDPLPVDRDGDGVFPPADCMDTNSTVWPGAREIPGNGLDDDCAGGDEQARLAATVSTAWSVNRRGARVLRMGVSEAPAGAGVTVLCEGRGCGFERRDVVASRNGNAALRRLFKRRLRPRTVVEIQVTAPNVIGKVVRYTVRRGKTLPKRERLCLPPGAPEPGRC
jgi:Putative metal-binding motif